MDKSNEEFKARLEGTHTFPADYLFKFIVNKEKLSEIERLFKDQKLTLKPSKNGNYISVSIRLMMESSDQVMSVYQSAAKIEGIISL